MRATHKLAGVCAALLSLALSGCGDDSVAEPTQRTLVIGVGEDVPGFSTMSADDQPVGFDIELARYVARSLGWAEREIEYRPIDPGDRRTALQSGALDLVVSTYPMLAQDERVVDFAGPYLIGKQDLLVAADNATITGPHSLNKRTLCSVSGSSDAATIKQERFSPRVRLARADSLSDCVDDLLAGDVDAVTADDVVLTGYVAQHRHLLKVVGSPFAIHRYGIGLPEGSPDVGVINDLITQRIDSGAWRNSFVRFLSKGGMTVPEPPVPGAPMTFTDS
ncbi:glutamate ABC transporter substrate-binding protein [soil metagenome]